MMKSIFRVFVPLAALAALTGTLVACSPAAGDGRYATQDRGRGNNRA